MTTANDSIEVTPGSGATVATQLVGTKEYQVVCVANDFGHIAGTRSVYTLIIPPGAAGANKVHFDLFNATGSGYALRVLSIKAIPDLDTAVTGAVSIQVYLTRTLSVGTGGTAATAESTSLTDVALQRWNPNNNALPAQITARAAPTGGAQAGAVLGRLEIAPEESNTSLGYSASALDFVPSNLGSVQELTVTHGTGLRVVQGSVASVGSVGFQLWFALE